MKREKIQNNQHNIEKEEQTLKNEALQLQNSTKVEYSGPCGAGERVDK